ncbi:MAG: hypothetical protein A2X31_09245 [Elusimicrobia bacterium GWB2_63_22]|nr:MAG: hypothetical protein A2X31_09245 [Elusimicrobia bacterium GWB2_63_22]
MPDIKKILLRSGPCLDSLPFLRLYLAALENPVSRFLALALRIKFSPDIFDEVRRSALPADQKAALFSRTMNLFKSGNAYKTTAAGRSPLTDAALLASAAPGSLIVETGVSDGVSALGLLERAKGCEVLLTDSQDCYRYTDFCCGRRFYAGDDGSVSVKLPLFYLSTGGGGQAPAGAGRISLLNPAVTEKFPGAELRPFDIFSGALPRKADLIKCANVLNEVYFTPGEIKKALANLGAGLKDGGRLFVCQNNGKYKDGEAYFVLGKKGGALALEAEVNGHELLGRLGSPEFADLLRP